MSFSADIKTSSENLGVLSSGTPAVKDEKGNIVEAAEPTLFSVIFDFLKDAGSWAEAVAKLIGLVS